MEITEGQLNTVLQEALTCYITFLSQIQKLRESQLPRQGKGVQTLADVSNELYYDARIASTKTCLQYTPKIARRVRRWHSRLIYSDDEEEDEADADIKTFEDLLRDQDISFEDVFSGACMQSSPNAGHSSRTNDTSRKCKGTRKFFQIDRCADIVEHEGPFVRENIIKYPPIPPLSSIGLHPNSRISSHRASDTVFSNLPSRTSSTVQTTPTSSALKDKKDTRDITSDMSKPYQAQKPRESKDEDYAHKIYKEDERKKRDFERESQRLADEIARAEKSRRSQERHAREIRREEKEKARERKRDQAIAQEQQRIWEEEALARQTEARMAEARRRKEEEEEKRAAQERKRARAEKEKDRERMLAKENEKRREARAAEKRREERKIKEEIRKRKAREAEAAKPKPPRKIDCVSCMEPFEKKDLAILGCKHAYCGDCIKAALKAALKSRQPFKCCAQTLHPSSLPSTLLSQSLHEKYGLFHLEHSTPHPLYCPSSTCLKFIPPSPSKTKNPIVVCPACNTRVCKACKKKEHKGVCAKDKEGMKVKELAKKQGWRSCPGCSAVVERTEGCLHMTCRCGNEWCWRCLRAWGKCESNCNRSASPPPNRDRPGQAGRAGTRNGIFPLVATAVMMALFD